MLIPWEVLALGAALLVLGISALVMAIKTKSPNSLSIDTKALAEEIGKVVGREIREALKGLPRGGIIRARDLPEEADGIRMDESIVPMKVEAVAVETNLEGMAKEEVKVDKDLADSKSKLANLLKKKKE